MDHFADVTGHLQWTLGWCPVPAYPGRQQRFRSYAESMERRCKSSKTTLTCSTQQCLKVRTRYVLPTSNRISWIFLPSRTNTVENFGPHMCCNVLIERVEA